MPQPDAAVEHYRVQQIYTNAVVEQSRRLWATIDPTKLDQSWSAGRVGERLYVTVSSGQQLAAAQADPYLDAVLAEQGIPDARTASVAPRSFAGVAADGRSLETLLYEPIITVKQAMSAGQLLTTGMLAGESQLVRVAATSVQDAGRTSVGAAIVARPAVTAYTRMLNPPSCSRCTVLAGRVYRWNAGFLRHPMCDCRHVPTSENVAGDLRTDPKAYFDSLSADDQAKYFTAAGAQAIRDGADIGRVVNVRRKGAMYQANGQGFTTAGTSRLPSGARRPLPETIYENATDRADALEQLRLHGYLV